MSRSKAGKWGASRLYVHARCLCRHGMVLNLPGRRRMTISNHIFYADRQAVLVQLRQRFGDVHIVDTPGLKHDMTLFIPASIYCR